MLPLIDSKEQVRVTEPPGEACLNHAQRLVRRLFADLQCTVHVVVALLLCTVTACSSRSTALVASEGDEDVSGQDAPFFAEDDVLSTPFVVLPSTGFPNLVVPAGCSCPLHRCPAEMSSEECAMAFVAELASERGLPSELSELRVEEVIPFGTGRSTVVLQQMWRGLPIEGALVTVTVTAGVGVHTLRARVETIPPAGEANPLVPESDALVAAARAVPETWRLFGGTLVLHDIGDGSRAPAWRIDGATAPGVAFSAWVDARTSELLDVVALRSAAASVSACGSQSQSPQGCPVVAEVPLAPPGVGLEGLPEGARALAKSTQELLEWVRKRAPASVLERLDPVASALPVHLLVDAPGPFGCAGCGTCADAPGFGGGSPQAGLGVLLCPDMAVPNVIDHELVHALVYATAGRTCPSEAEAALACEGLADALSELHECETVAGGCDWLLGADSPSGPLRAVDALPLGRAVKTAVGNGASPGALATVLLHVIAVQGTGPEQTTASQEVTVWESCRALADAGEGNVTLPDCEALEAGLVEAGMGDLPKAGACGTSGANTTVDQPLTAPISPSACTSTLPPTCCTAGSATTVALRGVCPVRRSCVSGLWSDELTVDTAKASPEICDGVDNDCNGTVDDIPAQPFSGGKPCPCVPGEVEPCIGPTGLGIRLCVAAAVPETPHGSRWTACIGLDATNPSCTPEVCNAKDDDCDNLVDEYPDIKPDPVTACNWNGQGQAPQAYCSYGKVVCISPPAGPTCADDECGCQGTALGCACTFDGLPQDTSPSGTGAVHYKGTYVDCAKFPKGSKCAPTTPGAPVCCCLTGAEEPPTPEVCDCKDNDFNGIVDDFFGGSTSPSTLPMYSQWSVDGTVLKGQGCGIAFSSSRAHVTVSKASGGGAAYDVPLPSRKLAPGAEGPACKSTFDHVAAFVAVDSYLSRGDDDLGFGAYVESVDGQNVHFRVDLHDGGSGDQGVDMTFVVFGYQGDAAWTSLPDVTTTVSADMACAKSSPPLLFTAPCGNNDLGKLFGDGTNPGDASVTATIDQTRNDGTEYTSRPGPGGSVGGYKGYERMAAAPVWAMWNSSDDDYNYQVTYCGGGCAPTRAWTRTVPRVSQVPGRWRPTRRCRRTQESRTGSSTVGAETGAPAS